MSSDPIEVLRKLAAKWREESGPVDQIHRLLLHEQSGALATHGCADELESALASLSAPKPSDDWVLVPREATGDMLEAGIDARYDDLPTVEVYAAMLAAAPKPESAEAVPAGYVQIAKSALRAMIGDERMAQIEGMCVFPTAPPRPEASDDAGMLPDALVPVSTEWYQLCERAAYSDSIKISGELAEAIVAAICARPTAPQQASAPVGVEGKRGELAAWLRDLGDVCSDLRPVGAWPGEKAAARLRQAASALEAVPVGVVPILKGIGKINGDGWKDTTKVGEVVYVWNTEMPAPHAAGQYPRVGNQCGWTASTSQYDFYPAAPEEVRDLFAALAQQPAAVGGANEVLTQRRREVAEDKGWDYTAYEQGRLAEKRRCISLLEALAGQQPAAVDQATCIAVYDAVSRSNLTRDEKTPEHKAAVVSNALAGQQQGGTP